MYLIRVLAHHRVFSLQSQQTVVGHQVLIIYYDIQLVRTPPFQFLILLSAYFTHRGCFVVDRATIRESRQVSARRKLGIVVSEP